MTIAETKLTDLIRGGHIGPSGHAPENQTEGILYLARPGKIQTLVESDPAGYPVISEQWDAILFEDGSRLITTFVRGNKSMAFWKSISNLDGFEVWQSARWPISSSR